MNGKLQEVLSQLLKSNRITASELSKHTGVSTTTLNRLLNDPAVNPTLHSLKLISTYFGITIDQLTGGEPLNKHVSTIPIVKWDKIDQWLENQSYSNEYIYSEKDFAKNAFAVCLESNEYNLIANEGTTIIISPASVQPDLAYGSILMVKIKNTISLKQLIISDGEYYLRSLDKLINKHIRINKHTSIIGVVNEIRVDPIKNPTNYLISDHNTSELEYVNNLTAIKI